MIAAVLGSAPCLRDDVDALEEMIGVPNLWIAVNDVGTYWPEVDAWGTLHPEKMERWQAERYENGHPDGYCTYARRCPDLVHEIVEHWGGGSVGLYGVRIAHHLGATHTVLCGCPMDKSGHAGESTEEHTFADHLEGARGYREAWRRKLRRGREAGTYLKEHTRSMSGWTRELLGEPDAEFLEGAFSLTQQAGAG